MTADARAVSAGFHAWSDHEAPIKRLHDLKPAAEPAIFAPPSPKMARRKPGKVLTAAEKAAFLASRPDLKPKS